MPLKQALIIDDEEHIREIATTALELTEGWMVRMAGCGADGIALARERPPDFILLDVMMPEMDGPTTLRVLREDERTRAIPVIFLTAKVQPADRRRFLTLDVQGVIGKPFDPLTLATEIQTILGRS